MRRQVGLLGGSFDPVHLGHLALARAARDGAGLDEVWWVPAGQPWQKARRLAPAEHRRALVELAIEGERGFRLEPCELDRCGPTYTIDTLRSLQDRTSAPADAAVDWWLVMGQDQFARLSTWRDWPELIERTGFAVALRDGQAPAADPALAGRALRVRTVPLAPVALSSTAVRERAAAGLGLAGMVPPAVEAYIAAHSLYRSPLAV